MGEPKAMKISCPRIIFLFLILASVLILNGCGVGNGKSALDFLGVKVPTSAVTSYKNQWYLKGEQSYITLKMSPTQIPAFLNQLRSKEDYSYGPFAKEVDEIKHNAEAAAFYKAVPASAQGGGFSVIHEANSENPYASFCTFAIDKATGKVWFHSTTFDD